MPSVVEEFEFIARRANEIRAARYQELGVSPPAALPGQRQPSAEEEPPASSNGCGFKYAPEFQHLAGQSSSIDDWSCCVPA